MLVIRCLLHADVMSAAILLVGALVLAVDMDHSMSACTLTCVAGTVARCSFASELHFTRSGGNRVC